MVSKKLLGIGAMMVLLAATSAAAGVAPGERCFEKKAKTAGKATSAVLSAYGRNEKHPDTTRLAASVSKAHSKLGAAFAKADPAETIDQQVPAACQENRYTVFGGGQTQGFIPTLSSLLAVDLRLKKLNFSIVDPTVTVRIRALSPTGPVVDEVSLVVDNPGEVGFWQRFTFQSPVPVVPGRLYFIHGHATNNNYAWHLTYACEDPSGTDPSPFLFRTIGAHCPGDVQVVQDAIDAFATDVAADVGGTP